MIEWRPTTGLFLIVAVGLISGILTGCGSSVPGLGDAESAMEDGNYQEALDHLDRAVEQDSIPTKPLLLRARVLRKMADTSQAPEAYAELFRRAYDAEESALEFDSTLASKVESRRRRIYERRFQQGEDAYNLASKHDKAAGFRTAARYFRAAAATRPDSTRPLLNAAYARLKGEERPKAIPPLRTYMERADSVSSSIYKLLAQLQVEERQFDDACGVLDRATTDYPEDEQLQALRITAYNRAGRIDDLLEAYRKQIENAPKTATYRYNYGSLLVKAHRFSEAIEQLTRAVEIQPNHRKSQFNLGVAYFNAARAHGDSIRTLQDDTTQVQNEVKRDRRVAELRKERRALLKNAIPPLERARKMGDSSGRMPRDACRALLTAYVQTDRPNRALQVEECSQFVEPRP